MSIDLVFAALASTPRRKILAYLSEASLTAGEIAERFEMTKPSLSKHLKVLEHAGLIKGDKRGQFVHYSLADRNMAATLHKHIMTFCPVGGPLKRESAAIAKARRQALPRGGR
jgi:ArsR family transcriptional regulator, arsenate/arsenite/antimonite-responsive transcriptional repressor